MTTRIVPEIKTEWCQRLRSGRYEQGEAVLRDDGKFCCLGVLGDIAVEQQIAKWDGPYLDDHFTDCEALIPPGVYTWATGEEIDLVANNDGMDIRVPTQLVLLMLPELGPLTTKATSLANKHINCHDRTIGLSDLNDVGFTFTQIATIVERLL